MHRAIPIFLAAGVAFGVGAISSAGSPEEDASNRFLDAWADQDFEAMYDELSPASQQEYPLEEFTAAYEDSQSAATVTDDRPGRGERARRRRDHDGSGRARPRSSTASTASW